MFSPCILPRVKKANKLSRYRVNRGDIASLKPVAKITGVCQIIQTVCTSVLAAENMVDLMRQSSVFLTQKAVFASAVGP